MLENDTVVPKRSNAVPRKRHKKRQGLLVASLLAFGLAPLFGYIIVVGANPTELFFFSYLIPWILLAFLVFCFPAVYLLFKVSFDLFHPLVYAAWAYFFPAFVLGSLFLATGVDDPWMRLISDPEYFLPLTLLYVILGFAGLTLGFAVPVGHRVGQAVSRRLPVWDWQFADLLRPALFLVLVGELCKLGAYARGSFGYQYVDEASTFGATLNILGLLSTMGSFLLWLTIFRVKRLRASHYLVIMFLLALVPYSMLLAGGRGALLQSGLPIIGAFVFSKRQIRVRQGLVILLLVATLLFAGMVYGTAFRQAKGTESQVSLREYFSLGVETLDQLSSRGLTESMSLGGDALLERLGTLSQLAVVVAAGDSLRSMEASYGVPGIWTMTWTAFIPRAIWPNKPSVSGARGLGLLYLGYGLSSPAVTPMMDLQRNYGPLGEFFGMSLLGLFLAVMYSALIQNQAISAWRAIGYYLLLTNVSYEGFYGTLLPVLIRVCFVFLLGSAIIYAMIPHPNRV